MKSSLPLISPVTSERLTPGPIKPSRYVSRLSGPLALAGLLMLSACASSQPDQRPERGERGPRAGNGAGLTTVALPIALLFATMDADQDRAVSATELEAGLNAEWAFADKDKSGSVSAIEFANWAGTSLGSQDTIPNRLSLDTDINGTVTETEFAEGMAAEFSKLDKNGDQLLVRSELLFVRPPQAFGGQSGEGRRQRPPGGGRGGRGGGGGGRGGRGGF
ncbi:MAG: hypothetical protein ABJG15_04360 [Hyphomonadaceae bacterium]